MWVFLILRKLILQGLFGLRVFEVDIVGIQAKFSQVAIGGKQASFDVVVHCIIAAVKATTILIDKWVPEYTERCGRTQLDG